VWAERRALALVVTVAFDANTVALVAAMRIRRAILLSGARQQTAMRTSIADEPVRAIAGAQAFDATQQIGLAQRPLRRRAVDVHFALATIGTDTTQVARALPRRAATQHAARAASGHRRSTAAGTPPAAASSAAASRGHAGLGRCTGSSGAPAHGKVELEALVAGAETGAVGQQEQRRGEPPRTPRRPKQSQGFAANCRASSTAKPRG